MHTAIWLTGILSLLLMRSAAAEPVGDGHEIDCVFKTPQGNTYDLTAHKSNQPYTLFSPDKHFEYHISVCNSIPNLSPACASHHFEPQFASSIQMDRRFGYCFVTGDIRHVYAEQADSENPAKGIDVVYPLGSLCGGTVPRELRIHFVCAPHHTEADVPQYVAEAAEKCHYNVTWPSMHACPRGYSLGAGAFWSLLNTISMIWYLAILVYALLGCCFNAWTGKAEFGWAAMPHKSYWERQMNACVPQRVKEWGSTGVCGRVISVLTRVASFCASIIQSCIVKLRNLCKRPNPTPAARNEKVTKPSMHKHINEDDERMLWADEDDVIDVEPKKSDSKVGGVARRAHASRPPQPIVNTSSSRPQDITRAIDDVAAALERDGAEAEADNKGAEGWQ